MTTRIPDGYRADANGNLIPDANIREIDKERDALVVALINQAKEHSGNLAIFKEAAQDAVQKFVAKSASKFRVKLGGRKHNVTLLSFDGRFKVISANSDLLVFDERLAAAKELVYKCVTSWSDGANSNMLAVINKAFDLDSDGNANAKRILGLKTLKIDDPQWQRAMEAVGQAVNVVGSKNYLRFYERTDSGDYKPIPLNITTE